MKYTGNFIVREGKLVPVSELHFKEYIKPFEGKVMIAEIKELGAKSPARMRAYYFGVLLDFFVPLWRERGMSMNKGTVDYHLQSIFAFASIETIPNMSGDLTYVQFFEERSKWSAKRWHDFISDCVQYAMDEFSATAPDCEEYLRNKREKK